VASLDSVPGTAIMARLIRWILSRRILPETHYFRLRQGVSGNCKNFVNIK
jgi:hypothetical protein